VNRVKEPENLEEWEDLRGKLAEVIQRVKGLKMSHPSAFAEGIPSQVLEGAIDTGRPIVTVDEFIRAAQKLLEEMEEIAQWFRKS
jgi:hypothetical protein